MNGKVRIACRRTPMAVLVCAIVVLLSLVPVAWGQCVPCPSDIAAWWPAEGDAVDIAGGNNGTLMNGLVCVQGMVGLAFRFGNPGEHVVVPDDPNGSLDFGPGADLSIDAWIAPRSMELVLPIVDKRELPNGAFSPEATGYTLFLYDGRLAFQMGDGQFKNYISTGQDLRDGQFHHVAVTVDRDSTTGGVLYVDTDPVLVFDPTTRPGDLGNGSPLFIGRHAGDPATCFAGLIDEVEIFHRVLDYNEVKAICIAGAAGKCKGPDLAVSILSTACTCQPAFGGYDCSLTVWALVTNVGTADVPAGTDITVAADAGAHGLALGIKTLTSPLAPSDSFPYGVSWVFSCVGNCFCPPAPPYQVSSSVCMTAPEWNPTNNTSAPADVCCSP